MRIICEYWIAGSRLTACYRPVIAAYTVNFFYWFDVFRHLGQVTGRWFGYGERFKIPFSAYRYDGRFVKRIIRKKLIDCVSAETAQVIGHGKLVRPAGKRFGHQL